MIKWALKSYKRPFIFLNLEIFILLVVVLLFAIPFVAQFYTVLKIN